MFVVELGHRDATVGKVEFTIRFNDEEDMTIHHWSEKIEVWAPIYHFIYLAVSEIIHRGKEIGDVRRALSTCFDHNNFLEIKQKHDLEALKKVFEVLKKVEE